MNWLDIIKTIIANYLARKLASKIERLEIKLDNAKSKLAEKLK
jgi:hypothetical protein